MEELSDGEGTISIRSTVQVVDLTAFEDDDKFDHSASSVPRKAP